MRSFVVALRFMHVVPPLSRLMHGTFACVTFTGMGAIAIDPGAASRALVPVLALQLFAVSTGFAGYVRRGHYDLLITGGVDRLTVAAAQWMMAALPGVLAWLALALVEAMARRGSPDLLSPGAAAAVWIASTLPWACTVALPRFSAAIGLCIGGISLAILGPPMTVALAPYGGAGMSSALTRIRDWVPVLASFPDAAIAGGAAAWLPAFGGSVSMLVALVWIARSSFPLESGQ